MTTKIEWTDDTWNPVTGCTKVSQGCKNCYAERLWPKVAGAEAKRTGEPPRAFTNVRCHPERLDAPLRWRKPRRIFVNSMSDLFHEDVPDEFIDRIFRVMIGARRHQFQILTKRPERMREYMAHFHPDDQGWVTRDGAPAMGKVQSSPLFADNRFPEPHIWLGVSVEDRETWLERSALLKQIPAVVRSISYEPALADLGPIDLTGINWLIAGGESGPKARPSHPDWFRSARDQCVAAGVAFFMKQITERGRKQPYEAFPADLQIREYPA